MKKILIAGEKDMCYLVEFLIKREFPDYEVAVVNNAPEAIKKAGNWLPDMIFLTNIISMPGGMDGLTLCQELRSNPALRGTKIIISSVPKYKDDAFSAGAAAFLPKPFNPEHIITAIKDAENLNRRINPSHKKGRDSPPPGEAQRQSGPAPVNLPAGSKVRRTAEVLKPEMGTIGFHCSYGWFSNDMIIMVKSYFQQYKDQPEGEEYLKLCYYNARAGMQIGDYADALQTLELIEKKEPYWLDAVVLQLHAASYLNDTATITRLLARFREIGAGDTLMRALCGDDPDRHEKEMKRLFPSINITELRKLFEDQPGGGPDIT